uniref:Uncharacterized protein n=1 Tax=Pseudo-nitzschia australis TaxID=44445 RepID=A0A7S4AAV4_9STRA|mmetsp:Transcript_16777/g.34478  ORF Transcript_16777/g.34478 Transcript_16777/m.34478 type:complete len:299 (+) Transcript_16777:98-994(+)
MDPFENSNHLEQPRQSRFRRAVRVLKGRAGPNLSQANDAVLSFIWIVSGVLTVLIPLIYRTIRKNMYREEYMKYFWEEEYEYYAEQRKQNYENDANGYNYGGAYTANAYSEYMDVNRCRWWQLNCFSFFVNSEGEPMEDQEWMPAWYSGFSLTEEERAEMQDNLEQPGSLKFVYVWQIVLFLALGVYGVMVIQQNRNPTGLIIGLLVWSNFAFLSMWLMADGSIITEGQDVKRTGFYGQMSVLIFMTNFWYFLHGLAFLLVFWIRASSMAEEDKKEKEQRTAAEAPAEKPYKAPATAL